MLQFQQKYLFWSPQNSKWVCFLLQIVSLNVCLNLALGRKLLNQYPSNFLQKYYQDCINTRNRYGTYPKFVCVQELSLNFISRGRPGSEASFVLRIITALCFKNTLPGYVNSTKVRFYFEKFRGVVPWTPRSLGVNQLYIFLVSVLSEDKQARTYFMRSRCIYK